MKTVQPRKQHRMLFQAPSHIRYRLFSAPLSSALKATHKVNSVPVRSGDTVRIMRGDKKGVEGKVSRIDRSSYRLFVEGVTREKVDGSAVQVPIHPSKVMITSLNLDDKWRRDSLKVEAPKEPEKPAEEPKKERRKRKPRQAPSEKPKAPRKRKVKKSEKKKEGEAESG
ncbi:MAG TPA: 50S ribosomal protein L24 [Candidatus Bathyarchaeia archaeon]|nr:50S ribosomal protein L24 [Candidatus Bathyarchaeia archaeon]